LLIVAASTSTSPSLLRYRFDAPRNVLARVRDIGVTPREESRDVAAL
jgi:hypothetical protein